MDTLEKHLKHYRYCKTHTHRFTADLLRRTWIGQYTGSDLFSDQDDIFLRILIPMVAQVATAPCTDPIQE
jgi:hypothetical protein